MRISRNDFTLEVFKEACADSGSAFDEESLQWSIECAFVALMVL